MGVAFLFPPSTHQCQRRGLWVYSRRTQRKRMEGDASVVVFIIIIALVAFLLLAMAFAERGSDRGSSSCGSDGVAQEALAAMGSTATRTAVGGGGAGATAPVLAGRTVAFLDLSGNGQCNRTPRWSVACST